MSVPAAADPHAGQRVVQRLAAWTKARLAVILLHGRGSAPEDLLELADEWNDERIYPDMGHSVNREEVEGVKALLLGV